MMNTTIKQKYKPNSTYSLRAYDKWKREKKDIFKWKEL